MNEKKLTRIPMMTPMQDTEKMATQLILGEVELKSLSLIELAEGYRRVDGMAVIRKGQILLEARNRFKSNREFKIWVEENDLDEFSQQTRHNYMQVAAYFAHRNTKSISLAVCTEIARPNNAAVADKVYHHALGKNYSKKEIIKYIRELKGEAVPVAPAPKLAYVLNEEELEMVDIVLSLFEDKTKESVKSILQACLARI